MTFPSEYQILNIEQGSLEWHELRARKYPASEAGAVMEVNPWQPKNRRELSAVRKGELHIEVNFAMDRGNREEAPAREWAEGEMQVEFPPCIAVRGEYMASLDGLSGDASVILELKVPMNPDKLYSMMDEGTVPPHYRYQMAQQAHCVIDAKMVMFAAYNPKTRDGRYMLIMADELRAEFAEAIHPAWEEFAGSNYEPIEVIRADEEFRDAAKAYFDAKTATKAAIEKAGIPALETAEKAAKKALIDACEPGLANRGFGIRVGWAEVQPGITQRKGSVRKTISGAFSEED